MNEQQATTIAAVATAMAPSGIGMVRLSGPEALHIAGQMVRPAVKGRSVETLSGYTGLLGRVFDAQGDVDDAVVYGYRAPKSYTGEDIAEICCHGGMYLLDRVLRRALELGAVPAASGEFTKRAYLAGKLGLTEAEAVADLISATGAQAAKAALTARDGAVSREIACVRDALVYQAAALAAWIDYPDEEQDTVFARALCRELECQCERLKALIENSERGALVRGGITAAILGRPNVGKSTLMNLLAGERKSIVTAVAGTTRDVVECSVRLGGVVLNLCDTAGIRETQDPVEQAGVALSWDKLENAQLLLFVLDSSELLTEEDWLVLKRLVGRPAIAVINKVDLGTVVQAHEALPYVRKVLPVSAQTGEGLQELEQAILEVLRLDHLEPGQALLTRGRQMDCAGRAHAAIEESLAALRTGVTLDAVNVLLDEAIDALLELTGERASEAVVNEVFSKFCVGK